RSGSASNILRGLIAFLISLLGTLLLRNEPARPWGVLLLITAAVLTVITWGRQPWLPAFARHPIPVVPSLHRSRSFYLCGVISAILLALLAGLPYLSA